MDDVNIICVIEALQAQGLLDDVKRGKKGGQVYKLLHHDPLREGEAIAKIEPEIKLAAWYGHLFKGKEFATCPRCERKFIKNVGNQIVCGSKQCAKAKKKEDDHERNQRRKYRISQAEIAPEP